MKKFDREYWDKFDPQFNSDFNLKMTMLIAMIAAGNNIEIDVCHSMWNPNGVTGYYKNYNPEKDYNRHYNPFAKSNHKYIKKCLNEDTFYKVIDERSNHIREMIKKDRLRPHPESMFYGADNSIFTLEQLYQLCNEFKITPMTVKRFVNKHSHLFITYKDVYDYANKIMDYVNSN